jgi:hypothetical protein
MICTVIAPPGASDPPCCGQLSMSMTYHPATRCPTCGDSTCRQTAQRASPDAKQYDPSHVGQERLGAPRAGKGQQLVGLGQHVPCLDEIVTAAAIRLRIVRRALLDVNVVRRVGERHLVHWIAGVRCATKLSLPNGSSRCGKLCRDRLSAAATVREPLRHLRKCQSACRVLWPAWLDCDR